MRAISLWQPWASLWCSTAKIHETRHWSLPHTGPIAVHAAKRLEREPGQEVDAICTRLFGPQWRMALPRGALIGVVEIIDCLLTEEVYSSVPTDLALLDDYYCGNFDPDRFAWRRGDFRLLPSPVPYRGRQSIFSVPDELVRR